MAAKIIKIPPWITNRIGIYRSHKTYNDSMAVAGCEYKENKIRRKLKYQFHREERNSIGSCVLKDWDSTDAGWILIVRSNSIVRYELDCIGLSSRSKILLKLFRRHLRIFRWNANAKDSFSVCQKLTDETPRRHKFVKQEEEVAPRDDHKFWSCKISTRWQEQSRPRGQ